MRDLYRDNRFMRDVKRMRKRGKDIGKLNTVVKKLLAGESLASRHRKHRLSGRLAHCWECHIEPDWVLIWEEDDCSIALTRTGTHSDFFK